MAAQLLDMKRLHADSTQHPPSTLFCIQKVVHQLTEKKMRTWIRKTITLIYINFSDVCQNIIYKKNIIVLTVLSLKYTRLYRSPRYLIFSKLSVIMYECILIIPTSTFFFYKKVQKRI